MPVRHESRPREVSDILARAASASTARPKAEVNGTAPYRAATDNVPEVEAFAAFAPSARRRGVLLVVECCWCSTPAVKSLHAHRAKSFEPVVREAGCRYGSYRITVGTRTWSR